MLLDAKVLRIWIGENEVCDEGCMFEEYGCYEGPCKCIFKVSQFNADVVALRLVNCSCLREKKTFTSGYLSLSQALFKLLGFLSFESPEATTGVTIVSACLMGFGEII